jgi:hypothetical protein
MDANTQIALTKSSVENEIKAYFQQVLELKQSGEEFPVSLDGVWPLVYGRKEEATRALKLDFIQEVDYQVLRKNAENLSGGRPVENYYLSVPCLEYFIARKVRPVFEVYRQVFHKAAEQKPLTAAEQLLANAKLLVEQERRLSRVESRVDEIDARMQTHPNYFTIVGYATLNQTSISLQQAASLGRQASELCKARNLPTGKTPDPRFGEVKTYPAGVLDEVFRAFMQQKVFAA